MKEDCINFDKKIKMFLLVLEKSLKELFFSKQKRTNVRRVFAIKSIQTIIEKHGAYLQINYWEKDSKAIKYNGMYCVLLSTLQTEGQHVNFLTKLLEV